MEAHPTAESGESARPSPPTRRIFHRRSGGISISAPPRGCGCPVLGRSAFREEFGIPCSGAFDQPSAGVSVSPVCIPRNHDQPQRQGNDPIWGPEVPGEGSMDLDSWEANAATYSSQAGCDGVEEPLPFAFEDGFSGETATQTDGVCGGLTTQRVTQGPPAQQRTRLTRVEELQDPRKRRGRASD